MMKKIIKEIFTDRNGKLSSKRIFGSIGFVISIIMIFCKIDTESLNVFIVGSFGLIGLGVAENLLNKIKK